MTFASCSTRSAADLKAADPERLRDTLRQIIDSIELSPETFEAALSYRVGPATKSRELSEPYLTDYHCTRGTIEETRTRNDQMLGVIDIAVSAAH